MAQTIDEVLSYLEETKQFDVAHSISDRLREQSFPVGFIEQILSTSFMYGPHPPSIEEQVNSADFSFWKSLAVYLSSQGFWPSIVVQML